MRTRLAPGFRAAHLAALALLVGGMEIETATAAPGTYPTTTTVVDPTTLASNDFKLWIPISIAIALVIGAIVSQRRKR